MRKLIVVFAALVGAGCATVQERVADRAAFDFGCPKPSLQMQMQPRDWGGGIARAMVTVGPADNVEQWQVKGCGKRATYTYQFKDGSVRADSAPIAEAP